MCVKDPKTARDGQKIQGSSFEPVLDFDLMGWLRDTSYLVLDPMGSISCKMIRGSTGLASDPSEIRLCAHRG